MKPLLILTALLAINAPAQEVIHAVTRWEVETNWSAAFPAFVDVKGSSFLMESGFSEYGTVSSNLYAVIDWKGSKKQTLLESHSTHLCSRQYTVENVKHYHDPKFTELNYSTNIGRLFSNSVISAAYVSNTPALPPKPPGMK